ncbi:AMP-binding protein [Tessaracoccus sp.]
MMRNEDPVHAVAAMLDGGPGLWLASGGCPTTLGDQVGAVVETSGSTGTGKRVVLSRAALLAAATASRSALGADLTWHLVLPPRYVAGLMVVVRSLVADRAPQLSTPDLTGLRPTGGGDAISIVGTQLHRALQDPELIRALAGFDVVLVGGAALAPALRQRAQEAGLQLTETYGMSETCGGVVWDGVALPGATVEVLPEDRAPENAGRISLGGPMLFDGYMDDQGTTVETPVAGMHPTADWGCIQDGRLTVGGRLDDVVITGGVNVDLAAVRRAVEEADPDAAVLAVPDVEWGCRIVLFAKSGTLSTWRARLALSMARPALPRQFVLVEEVPRTSGGKPERHALLALVPR